MNKTITANVGGFVFNIEEQAYETLSRYLKTIRQSMQNEESVDEVMQDIEHRIAEIFHDVLQKNKREVIDGNDITLVIDTMGQPEDFHIEDETKNTSSKTSEKENSTTEKNGGRQFYRDPDDKIVGGICSGLSAYFGWDPLFMRIAFVILFFGFGSGILIYILLWLIIPEASTTAEKMRMRGEKVDVESIKQRFQNIKKDVEDLGSEERRQKINESSRKFSYLVNDLAQNFYKVFGNLLGFILLILGVVFLIWLVKSAFSSNFIYAITDNGLNEIDLSQYGQLVFGSLLKSNLVFLSIFILILIPIISMLMAGFRLIFKRKFKTRVISAIFSVSITLAVICLFFMIIQTAVDFGKTKTSKENFHIENTSDTLIIKMNPDPYFADDYEDHHDAYFELLTYNDKKIISGMPLLDIIPSEDSTVSITIEKIARGKSQNEAAKRAQNIEYKFNSTNNEIYFNPYFVYNKSDLIRSQECYIHIKVPQGKTIYLDPSTDRIIYDIQNLGDYSDEDMTGRYWIMNNGLLELSRPILVPIVESKE